MNHGNTSAINNLKSPFVRCSWEKNNNNFKLDYSAANFGYRTALMGMSWCTVTWPATVAALTTLEWRSTPRSIRTPRTPRWHLGRRPEEFVARPRTLATIFCLLTSRKLRLEHERLTVGEGIRTFSSINNEIHCSASFAIELASQSIEMNNYQIPAAQLLLKISIYR